MFMGLTACQENLQAPPEPQVYVDFSSSAVAFTYSRAGGYPGPNGPLFTTVEVAKQNGAYVAHVKTESCEVNGGLTAAEFNNIMLKISNSQTEIGGTAPADAPVHQIKVTYEPFREETYILRDNQAGREVLSLGGIISSEILALADRILGQSCTVIDPPIPQLNNYTALRFTSRSYVSAPKGKKIKYPATVHEVDFQIDLTGAVPKIKGHIKKFQVKNLKQANDPGLQKVTCKSEFKDVPANVVAAHAQLIEFSENNPVCQKMATEVEVGVGLRPELRAWDANKAYGPGVFDCGDSTQVRNYRQFFNGLETWLKAHSKCFKGKLVE
jgi:hypothetical protein